MGGIYLSFLTTLYSMGIIFRPLVIVQSIATSFVLLDVATSFVLLDVSPRFL